MSGTAPKNQDALTWNHRAPTPEARQRGRCELLYEFLRTVDKVRIRCEIVDDGSIGGFDVQILRNEEFFYSRRFPLRGFAEQWAQDERLALEAYDPDMPF
jgi:hypothetical protein